MSSEIPELEKEKAVEICHSCGERLRASSTYPRTALCPTCDQKFLVEASIRGANNEDHLRKKIYIRQGSFWLGLVIPVIPSIIMMFFVLMTGDVNVLFYWMCSLCLWPIIGFVIGMSVVFVESFRAGGRVSAIIGLIVAVLVWLWVFSWLPDALRRSHSR
ncbi:MAG: hypothetical protein CMB49_00590 [Euryarchaeota archaeon]|nr:hypothetical protein [Euryarchaeota archaeon]